jgi:hypothetical protein
MVGGTADRLGGERNGDYARWRQACCVGRMRRTAACLGARLCCPRPTGIGVDRHGCSVLRHDRVARSRVESLRSAARTQRLVFALPSWCCPSECRRDRRSAEQGRSGHSRLGGWRAERARLLTRLSGVRRHHRGCGDVRRLAVCATNSDRAGRPGVALGAQTNFDPWCRRRCRLVHRRACIDGAWRNRRLDRVARDRCGDARNCCRTWVGERVPRSVPVRRRDAGPCCCEGRGSCGSGRCWRPVADSCVGLVRRCAGDDARRGHRCGVGGGPAQQGSDASRT